MSETKVKPCDCKHPWQDKRYGKGLRLHNKLGGVEKSEKWRCTVCGKTR